MKLRTLFIFALLSATSSMTAQETFKFGTNVNPDGVRFEGTYVDDLKDGYFVEKNHNGTIIRKGYYSKGRLQIVQ